MSSSFLPEMVSSMADTPCDGFSLSFVFFLAVLRVSRVVVCRGIGYEFLLALADPASLTSLWRNNQLSSLLW